MPLLAPPLAAFSQAARHGEKMRHLRYVCSVTRTRFGIGCRNPTMQLMFKTHEAGQGLPLQMNNWGIITMFNPQI
jgi:hypothetical protein